MEKVSFNVIVISYIMKFKKLILGVLLVTLLIYSLCFENFILAMFVFVIFNMMCIYVESSFLCWPLEGKLKRWIYAKYKNNFDKLYYIVYDASFVSCRIENIGESMIYCTYFYDFVIYMNSKNKVKVLQKTSEKVLAISDDVSELKSYLRGYLLKKIRKIHEDQRMVTEHLNKYAILHSSLDEFYDD